MTAGRFCNLLINLYSIAQNILRYHLSFSGDQDKSELVLRSSKAERIEKRCRKVTSLPLIVGFGISTADHVRAMAKSAVDGVIVASRLVREMPDLDIMGRLCKSLSMEVR